MLRQDVKERVGGGWQGRSSPSSADSQHILLRFLSTLGIPLRIPSHTHSTTHTHAARTQASKPRGKY